MGTTSTPMYCTSLPIFTPPFLLLLNLVAWTTGMKLTNMTAPLVQDLRENMDLNCQFDMGAEELYAVKWYKDDNEFFRYMPRQTPETVTFPAAGVKVILPESDCGHDHCRIRLTELKRDFSGGLYKCEISSEAPAFKLASQTNHVTIAALPKEKPRIEGLAKSYTEGETVSVKCISSPAFPTPILSFYINKKEASSKLVSEMTNIEPDKEGLVSRMVSLRFPAEKKYANGDLFEFECKLTLPGVPFEAQVSRETAVFKHSQQPQIINNQKLHWHTVTSSSSRPENMSRSQQVLLMLLLTTVRWIMCLDFDSEEDKQYF